MSTSRYNRTPRILGGTQLATSRITGVLYENSKNGNIATFGYVLKEGERLDHLAGRFFGNGDLWWVIAATSGIGWMPQVPAGTRVKIPENIDQVMLFVS